MNPTVKFNHILVGIVDFHTVQRGDETNWPRTCLEPSRNGIRFSTLWLSPLSYQFRDHTKPTQRLIAFLYPLLPRKLQRRRPVSHAIDMSASNILPEFWPTYPRGLKVERLLEVEQVNA